MATTNLTVSELDFDRIKQNLKDFLRDPTLNPEFQDYDFEASGLAVLIDLLAYNTHYNSYYLNMVSNESFLDTAKIRSSVVSHAKTLGYTPYSTTAAVAYINFTVETSDNSPGELIIPANYTFLSNLFYYFWKMKVVHICSSYMVVYRVSKYFCLNNSKNYMN